MIVKHLHYKPKLDSNPDLSMDYFLSFFGNGEDDRMQNIQTLLTAEEHSELKGGECTVSSTEPSVFPHLKRSFIRSISSMPLHIHSPLGFPPSKWVPASSATGKQHSV